MNRIRKPTAYCVKCHKYYYDMGGIGKACSVKVGSKKCGATISSALSKNDWTTCKSCNGSGCPVCDGSGWKLERA